MAVCWNRISGSDSLIHLYQIKYVISLALLLPGELYLTLKSNLESNFK